MSTRRHFAPTRLQLTISQRDDYRFMAILAALIQGWDKQLLQQMQHCVSVIMPGLNAKLLTQTHPDVIHQNGRSFVSPEKHDHYQKYWSDFHTEEWTPCLIKVMRLLITDRTQTTPEDLAAKNEELLVFSCLFSDTALGDILVTLPTFARAVKYFQEKTNSCQEMLAGEKHILSEELFRTRHFVIRNYYNHHLRERYPFFAALQASLLQINLPK